MRPMGEEQELKYTEISPAIYISIGLDHHDEAGFEKGILTQQ
jgi:hypothetical protein